MSSRMENPSLGEVKVSDNSWNVADGITRVSFGFPNMYIVEGNKSCALIDSGWGDEDEVDSVRDQIDSTRVPLEAMVVTHRHPDHEGGVSKLRGLFPGIPVVGLNRRQVRKKVIDLEGRRLTVFSAPGHTKDSKYVFDSETRVLFTGDNILGDLSGDIKEMGQFMDGLGALVSLQPKVLCPGHYESVYGATQAVGEVLRHREEREQQVLGALTVGELSTLDQLFDRIYGEKYLLKKRMVTFQIESHLIKLLEEGKVDDTPKGWKLSS